MCDTYPRKGNYNVNLFWVLLPFLTIPVNMFLVFDEFNPKIGMVGVG